MADTRPRSREVLATHTELPRSHRPHHDETAASSCGTTVSTSTLHHIHQLAHRGLEAIFFEPTLPDDSHGPAACEELRAAALVPDPITRELGLPERGIRPWKREVAVGTVMPEAAIHKDRRAASRVADIGPSRSLLPVQAIAPKTRCTQSCPHLKLGPGVLALVGLHDMVRGQAHLTRGGSPCPCGRRLPARCDVPFAHASASAPSVTPIAGTGGSSSASGSTGWPEKFRFPVSLCALSSSKSSAKKLPTAVGTLARARS